MSTTELVPVGTRPKWSPFKRTPVKNNTKRKRITRAIKTRAQAACGSFRYYQQHPRFLGETLPDGSPLFTRAEMRAYNRKQMARESRRRNLSGASSVLSVRERRVRSFAPSVTFTQKG